MFTRKRMLLLFLLPGLAGMALFYLIPFIYGIYFSVTDGSFQNAYVGFDNYIKVWQNEMFLLGLRNTMELSLICAPVIFALALAMAGLLKSLAESSVFYRNVLLLPYLMPSSAMILIWLLMFDYSGVVNKLLVTVLQVDPRPIFTDGPLLRVPVILLYVWKNLGFSVVIFTSALQAVPEAYYEYARLEGASRFKQTLSITLPLVCAGDGLDQRLQDLSGDLLHRRALFGFVHPTKLHEQPLRQDQLSVCDHRRLQLRRHRAFDLRGDQSCGTAQAGADII